MRTYADGQLPAAAAVLFTAGKDGNFPSDGDVTAFLALSNTSGVNTETVTLTFKRQNGTARRIARLVLAPNETGYVRGIAMQMGDAILGVTSDATTVDYVIGQGAAGFEILTFDSSGQSKLTNNTTVSGALALTTASANALAVGRQGTTSPAFNVDASTGTSVTGVNVKAGASGGGVAISVIGGAAAENLFVDAKGAGAMIFGDTSTGQTFIGRGALKAPIFAETLTALGTTQNSTPTAAQLLGGQLTQTSATGAGTITLPTGTALSAACTRAPTTGDSFDCLFANLGGGFTLTVTGAAGTTVQGGATIASAKTAKLTFTCTGANAWNIYTTGG